MNRSTLFSINSIVAVLFGLGFVLIPATVVSWYGVTLNDGGIFTGRLLGAAFLAFAILSWLVRNSAWSDELGAILLAFFIGDLIGFVISLVFQLQGLANALGWSSVAIYLLLSLGFGYFYWKK
jgi:hypothetical protein